MKIRLLLLLSALVIVLKGTAQFSGDFAPAKWTFSTTTISGDGSVNTSGAPASIILNGSDNNGPGGGGQYENYQVPIVTTGTISFSYNHSNNDVDGAFYAINGVTTSIASSGSGTKTGIAVTAGQTFAFRVVNDDNCCGRGILTITNFVFTPASPIITTQPANKTVCTAGTATFTVVAANTTSYQWQENSGSGFTNITNGGIYGGATTATLTITGVTAGMNGYLYRCIATGTLNPPATSNNATLTVSPMVPSISSQTNVSCNGGTNGAATVSVTGGTGIKTYSWAPSGGTGTTASGLAAGNYTITITDATSCVTTQTVSIFQPSAITSSIASLTNVACFGGSNGAATITASGGTGILTYNWTPGNPTGDGTNSVSGLTAGSWTCTVTDANSCTKTQTVNITAPVSAVSGTTVVTNVACFGGANGAINLTPSGGTGPYTFNWLPSGPTTEDRTGLTAGTFTVQITDVNGCTGTVNATVTQPTSPVSGTTVITNVSCFGGSNASINLTPTGGTGPYTFNWLPAGPTTEDRTGLTAGTFTVQITDVNGCTGTVTATLTQPTTPVSGSTIVTNIACNGGSNGSVDLTPSGGTPGYTYNWGGGVTTQDRTGLMAGTYTVVITDANSCQGTVTATVTQPAALTATTAQTNIACNSGSTGSATVTPSGGTPSYSYSWAPSGGIAATASGLSAGTYTVTITDANSCSITKNITITEPTTLTATTSQTNISCNGGATGSATITPSGGTPGYTYSWAPSGGTAATASGLITGTYTVTITDANSCSITKNVAITQPTALTATTSQTNISCNGGADGSATVSPSGGTPGYTYSWAPSGGTAATASGLITGTYTVTITDANNCNITKNFSISQPAILTSTGTQMNVSCNGGANGSATVTATGGITPYAYTWAPSGGTAATASGLVAGTYTVTITDANNCTATRSFIITQPSLLTATTTQINVNCKGANSGSATVTASGGTPTYTYVWAPSGGTAATATALVAGTYTITITDANNCSITKNVTLTEPATVLSSTGTQTDLTCNGGANGSATVTAVGGTPGYTYSWIPSGGTAATASGLSAGTYSVIVSDANACTTIRPFTILQPTAITATTTQANVACHGEANGSATVIATGGTGALTYSWAPSGGTATTATGLTAGTYTVTITDANTCSITKTVMITEPAILASTGSQVNVACNGGSDGSATVTPNGGTTPYSYAWAPSGGTTATATGLAQGSYTVTITDAKGCITTRNFNITQPNILTATTSQTNIACNGEATGIASVMPTGGTGAFTYAWAPSGGTAATATGLAQGSYTVTITDANNCSITKSFTITEPTAITATTSQTNVECNGEKTGIATVIPTGGTPGYTYSWAPLGGTAATATGLGKGSYTVTITDASNCSITKTASITEPTAITATTSQVNVSCYGGLDGSAGVTVTGGTPGYTYEWFPYGGTASTATGLSAKTYTVSITDANNCNSTTTISITEPALLAATISAQTNISCNGGADGSATVSGSGGTAPYTYSWAPSGGTAATATGLTMGTYTVTITDTKNCVATQTVSITQPAAITATTNQTNVSCKGGTNGSATVIATGGTGAYTYAWAPSGGTAATATGLAQGGYTVTITDANNCSITRSFTITEPAALTATTSQTNVGCNGDKTGSATVIPVGGTPGYTYSWMPSGGTAATATALAMGTYTVTITDANSCSITKTVSITEPTLITATTSQVNVSCYGGLDGSAEVTVTGGTPGYTYEWLPSGGTASTATGLSAKTYTVNITDANNCKTSKMVTITEPPVLAATISTQTNVSCNGGSNGSASVAATGGTGAYTYSWAPSGGTAATASGLAMGTYTVTVTDANNCTTTTTVSITQPNAIIATNAQTNVSCKGGTNGSATVTVTGGTGVYTYAWAPSGGTAATATGLSQGGYTVTITDANNCSITKSFTITEPAELTAVTSQTNVACNGGASGSASVNVSGGTTAYIYSWAPSGGTAATATGLVAGTYTCTITDANNCILTKIVTLTEPPVLSATTAQTNVSCNGGANGSATVTATGGTGALIYSWAPSGGTAATATGLSHGTYTVTITDANLCSTTQTVTIVQPSAITASTTQTNVSCKGGSNGSAKVTATGGTGILTYAWAPSGGTAATASGLIAGTYTCTITDANLCSTTQTVTITEPDLLASTITHTNVSCNSGTNGTAVVTTSGGTSPYTYAWIPSGGTAATATGLVAGTYTVTITDANMCTTTQSVTITEPPVLTATSTKIDILCHGDSTGAASVTPSGGTTPYAYSWIPSGGTAPSATGLTAGSYTVIITDANNCKYEEKITITEPAELLITSTQKNITCNGGADGSATVTVTGGFGAYTYSWAPSGGTAATITGVTAGNYTVTVTDGYSCIKTHTVTITEPVMLSANITKTDVYCHGDSTGTAIVTPTGGTAPYTYSWNPPYTDTDSVLTHLPVGTYTCTITDAHNCKFEAKVVITEPNILAASIIHKNVSCFGGENGSATITTTGGTAPYSFVWTPTGGTSSTASGLKAGTYTCTVKDTMGCSTTQTVTITEPVKLVITGTATALMCHGDTAVVDILAAGGTPPYTGTGKFYHPAGTHTFVISDNNSCMDSLKLSIIEPLAITGIQTIYICKGDKLVVGDSIYTTSGTYVNVLKAANTCDSTVTTYLSVNTVETTVTVGVGIITSNAINSMYQWIDCTNGNTLITGATGQSYNVIKSGDYAVVVTTENCSDTSACTHVTVTGIDQYTLSDQLNIYPNPSNGTVTIHTTVAGTYSIINELGQTIRSFQLNSANNYTATFSELDNGTYYVIGINKNQLMRQKIVVLQYR